MGKEIIPTIISIVSITCLFVCIYYSIKIIINQKKFQPIFDSLDLLDEAFKIELLTGDKRKSAIYLLKHGREVKSEAFQKFLKDLQAHHKIEENEII